MKIVIDIPQIMYGEIKQYGITFLSRDDKKTLRKLIANGVPLPKGHGRLMDADALMENCEYYETRLELKNVSTIIEAEEE